MQEQGKTRRLDLKRHEVSQRRSRSASIPLEKTRVSTISSNGLIEVIVLATAGLAARLGVQVLKAPLFAGALGGLGEIRVCAVHCASNESSTKDSRLDFRFLQASAAPYKR